MDDSEKSPKVCFPTSWSRRKQLVPSDEVSRSSDCGNRTDIKLKVCLKKFEKVDKRYAGSWVGRSPFRKLKNAGTRYVIKASASPYVE